MQKRLAGILAIVMLMAVPVCSVAAVANNEVTSIKIKDGEVMTVDLANKAVTAAKIADATITATQLANGAVTDVKITGPISGSKLGAHAHNASDIVGTISATKLPVGTTAGTVSAGDHNHDTLYQKKYAKAIVVAYSGGDFTSPVDAINSITDAAEANQYLIKIMPGNYSLENTALQMKAYVDIEGAGENTTQLRGYSVNGIVRGASNAEIRNITIWQKNPLGYLYGIINDNASPKISNVTIDISVNGMAIGVANGNNSSPIMNNVTIFAANAYSISGYSAGVRNQNSSPIMNNVQIDTSASQAKNYGILNMYNSSPIVNNSTITSQSNSASNFGIYSELTTSDSVTKITNTIVTGAYYCGIFANAGAIGKITIDRSTVESSQNALCNNDGSMFIGNSKISGSVTNASALKCFGAYDGNYDAVTCQ